MDTFKSFDIDMKVGTRQRRENDEFKIFKMKQQLAGLESNLHAEVKYRQEMNKSVQNWMSDEVNALTAHCDDLRDDQQLRIQRRIDKVANRITDMEQRFAKDMAEIPVQIEERSVGHTTSQLFTSSHRTSPLHNSTHLISIHLAPLLATCQGCCVGGHAQDHGRGDRGGARIARGARGGHHQEAGRP